MPNIKNQTVKSALSIYRCLSNKLLIYVYDLSVYIYQNIDWRYHIDNCYPVSNYVALFRALNKKNNNTKNISLIVLILKIDL